MKRVTNELTSRFTQHPNPPLMRFARLAGWAGIAAIAILSLLPGSERPHTGYPGRVEHLAAYACTGLALSIAYLGFRERLIFWAGLATASGLFEVLQAWIPGRASNFRDAAASATGITVGLVIGACLATILPGRSRASKTAEHDRRVTGLSVDEPQDERQCHAEEEPGGDRDVKGKVLALDDDVARQMSET